MSGVLRRSLALVTKHVRPAASLTPLPTPTFSRRMPLGLVAATALIAAGASTTAVLIADAGAPDARPAAAAPAPAAADTGGLRLKTSYGSVSVDYVARMVGSSRPMGLRVPEGRVPVQIGVTVLNTKDRPLQLDTNSFRFAKATPGYVDFGRFTDGKLPAYTAHRVVLRSSVVDDTALPNLLVRDPSRTSPMQVALGGRPDELSTLDVSTHHFGGPKR